MCNVMFYDYCLCYTMTNIFIKKLFENISTAILLSSSAFYALHIHNAKYVQQSPNLITSPSQRTRALNWRRNLPFFPSHLRTLIAKVLCQEELYQCCNYVKGSKKNYISVVIMSRGPIGDKLFKSNIRAI